MGNSNPLEQLNLVKSNIKGKKCPHCEKEIVISTITTTAAVDWMLRPEDLEVIRKRIKDQIEKLNLSDVEREGIEAFLNNQNNFIGPEEENEIIENIKQRMENETTENKTE